MLEGLMGMILAVFDAFAKRNELTPAGRVLRQALAQRVAPAGGTAAAGKPALPRGPLPVARLPAVPVLLPVPPQPAGLPAAGTRTPGPTPASSAEAGLVGRLFASPQSLVAAFIVGEVLAKPVALRDK